MKNYLKIAFSISSAAALCSCVGMMDDAQNVPVIEPITVSYKVSAATGFIPKGGIVDPDPSFSTQGVTVSFLESATGAVTTGVTDADCVATVELIPGDYTISVTGKVENDGTEYYLNGSINSVSLVKDISKQEAMASSGLVVRPAKVGSLCISEIYYCGIAPYYFRDQTYQIYNNGNQVEYLDGLCFAQLHPNIASATSVPPVWPDEEGENNYVYGLMVWQFPGSGQEYPLQPGESVVVVQEARDHRENNPDSFDNSMADWECWTGNVQRDNPDVENMPLLYAQSLNKLQWLTSVFGAAFCIYRADDGTVLDEAYYKDKNNTQTEVNKSSRYARIPASYILDGVELMPNMDILDKKRIPGFVDAGAASVGDTYCGKVVARKVVGTRPDGTPIFSDTNNSTDDFEVLDSPMIRRYGQKAPAWSK